RGRLPRGKQLAQRRPRAVVDQASDIAGWINLLHNLAVLAGLEGLRAAVRIDYVRDHPSVVVLVTPLAAIALRDNRRVFLGKILQPHVVQPVVAPGMDAAAGWVVLPLKRVAAPVGELNQAVRAVVAEPEAVQVGIDALNQVAGVVVSAAEQQAFSVRFARVEDEAKQPALGIVGDPDATPE